MHVGVVEVVVVDDRVDHALRLLAGRRIVEIDQTLPVLLLRENRKVGPDAPCVEHQKSFADSVVTGSALFWSAACNACQARFAHLMRLGNARTPENAASLPGAFAPPVSMSRKAWNIASASDLGLPLTASVMSDADAFEIAHPEPCGI